MDDSGKVIDEKHRKVRIGVFLARWQKEALDKIAEREGRTVADLIRQMTGSFLRSRSQPGKWTEEIASPPGQGND